MSFRMIDDGKPHWYRRRDGDIVLCVCRPEWSLAIVLTRSMTTYSVIRNGSMGREAGLHDIVEHLPDCDGFDWQPSPKVIPWTFETMPVAVKVVMRKSDHVRFVAWSNVECSRVDGRQVSYDDLLRDYVQLDGSPCGEVVS